MGLSIKDLDVSKFSDAIKRLYVDSNGKGLFEIKLRGGGEVPNSLKGFFTSYGAADERLYFHILNKTFIPEPTEPKKNGTNKRK